MSCVFFVRGSVFGAAHFYFGVSCMSKSFGEKLRRLRKSKGYTQEKLAKLLNIDRTTLTKYETGVTEPDLTRLKEIRAVFGVDYNTLLNN